MTQLDIMTAIRRKAEGLDRAESGAGDFVPLMRKVAHRIATEQGSVCSDDLRRYAAEHGIAPSHPNGWGAVFRAGAGFRLIGRRKSTWPSAHRREVKVWAV